MQINLPRPRSFLLLGLLIGLTAMGVATILFLLPLLVAASFRTSPQRPARRIPLSILLLACGVIAGTSPCWIHNYFVARDPVFLSAHSGINFWIGNNPDANGYPRFPPGLHAGQAAMLQDSITAAESAAGRPLKRAEVSQFWSAKARLYIAGHPTDWFILVLVKFRNFWSAFRYDDLSIVTSLREHRVIWPGLEFGIVAAFGVAGMFVALAQKLGGPLGHRRHLPAYGGVVAGLRDRTLPTADSTRITDMRRVRIDVALADSRSTKIFASHSLSDRSRTGRCFCFMATEKSFALGARFL